MKYELLEYVKKLDPNAPIPASLMTCGELAELLQSRAELQEGMKLIMSCGSQDSESVRILNWTADEYTADYRERADLHTMGMGG